MGRWCLFFWSKFWFLSGYILSCHNWRGLIVRARKILWRPKFSCIKIWPSFYQTSVKLIPKCLVRPASQPVHTLAKYAFTFLYFYCTQQNNSQLCSKLVGSVSFCSPVIQAGKQTNRLCSPDPLFPTPLNSSSTPLSEWHAWSCGLS